MEYEEYCYNSIKKAKKKVEEVFNKYGYNPAIKSKDKIFKIIIPKNLMRIDK